MQKHANLVDLGESFPTHIYLQKSASIQPRTIPVKFARSPCTDPPGALLAAPPHVLLGEPFPALRPLQLVRLHSRGAQRRRVERRDLLLQSDLDPDVRDVDLLVALHAPRDRLWRYDASKHDRALLYERRDLS